jgi:hypothetical protein
MRHFVLISKELAIQIKTQKALIHPNTHCTPDIKTDETRSHFIHVSFRLKADEA